MATSTVANPPFPPTSSPAVQENHSEVANSPLAISQSADPLKVALSGFPDVNSYLAYYEGAGHDID